jgi:hypothetical protein
LKKHLVDIINYSIQFGILLVAIIALWRSCATESEVKSIEYVNKSIEYRPRIKFFKDPTLKGIFLVPPVDPSQINPGLYFMKFVIYFENVGNCKAIIDWRIGTDTASGTDYIRTSILNKDFFFMKTYGMNQYSTFNSMKELEINEKDSAILNLRISDEVNDTVIFHILFLYNNELGNVFDSYYWVRFLMRPPFQISFSLDTIVPPNGGTFHVDQYQINGVDQVINNKGDNVKFIDYRSTSMLYSKDEAQQIMTNIEHAKNKFKKSKR